MGTARILGCARERESGGRGKSQVMSIFRSYDRWPVARMDQAMIGFDSHVVSADVDDILTTYC